MVKTILATIGAGYVIVVSSKIAYRMMRRRVLAEVGEQVLRDKAAATAA